MVFGSYWQNYWTLIVPWQDLLHLNWPQEDLLDLTSLRKIYRTGICHIGSPAGILITGL